VATGMIAKIESPLEGLSPPRRRRAKRDRKKPPVISPRLPLGLF
jgi:hypothetical protein